MGPVTVNAAAPVALVVVLIGCALLVIASVGVWLWGLIDAAQRPDWAYATTGSNKMVWIVLIAVLGAVPALIYLFAIRPGLQAAQDAVAWRTPEPVPMPAAPKFCARCGAGLPSDAQFCRRCAAPQ